MRKSIFELVLQYTDQLLKAVAAIGFYDHVIEDIEDQMNKVQPVYDDFKTKTDDPEYFGPLSPPEKQALGQNEINYKHLLRTMNETVTHLIGQKWTNNVRAAIWVLDDLVLTLQDVLANTIEDGKQTKATELVPQKKFADADYLGRIAIVQTAIGVLRDDVTDQAQYGDTGIPQVEMFAWSINNSLGKTVLLLQREMDDIEANGLPTLHTFDIPPVVEPEIPDSPQDKKGPVQTKLPLDVEPEKVSVK